MFPLYLMETSTRENEERERTIETNRNLERKIESEKMTKTGRVHFKRNGVNKKKVDETMMSNSTHYDFFLPEYESLPRWLLIPFLSISIIESVIGVLGNILVIVVLLFFAKPSNPQTSHHCFIINLALSDFVLCLFTMPLNTYRSLYIYMRFPPALCKLADSFPAINICVSSLTIVTISIYRYLAVCYPHRRPLGIFQAFLIMISIWLLAIGAASPLFIYSQSIPAYDDYLIETMVEVICNPPSNNSCETTYLKIYQGLHVCHESWPPYGQLRLLYTIFMLFLQFILPILIICLTYYQVMIKLRERFRYRFLMKRNNIASLRHEISRQRRNNILLLLIVFLYAISWLPFNIFYIVFLYANSFRSPVQTIRPEKGNDLSKFLPFRFLLCMISAISNPFLYSYFNETFKDGLQRIRAYFSPEIRQRLFEQVSLNRREANSMQKMSQKSFSKKLNSGQSVVLSTARLEENLDNVRTVIEQTTSFLLTEQKIS